MRRFTRRKLAATGAIFVALAGVAYAAVTGIPDKTGVFHGCVSKRNGALRVVRSATSCRKGTKQQGGEFAIKWNQKGPKGPPGKPGPQGPGAQSFESHVAQGSTDAPLATLDNGLTISGTCTNTHVTINIRAQTSGDVVQMSGTASGGSTLVPFNTNAGGTSTISSTTTVDFDTIARDSTSGGKFARIDVHGELAAQCEFWGMVTPSS